MLSKRLNNNLSLLEKKSLNRDYIIRKIRILVPSQKATITPPIGPTLGQFGINIKDFCEKFNEKTKNIDPDVLLIVEISLFKNKNFTFDYKISSLSFLVNEEDFFIQDKNLVHKFLSLSSFYKILKFKNSFLNFDEYFFSLSFIGSIYSMNIFLVNDLFQE
jgi:large subunit ribosomal protein L11